MNREQALAFAEKALGVKFNAAEAQEMLTLDERGALTVRLSAELRRALTMLADSEQSEVVSGETVQA